MATAVIKGVVVTGTPEEISRLIDLATTTISIQSTSVLPIREDKE